MGFSHSGSIEMTPSCGHRIGHILMTSLGVNLVYWFSPVMKRFRTAFMNVVGAGNPSEA